MTGALGDRHTQDLREARRQAPRLFSTSVLHLHWIARGIFSEVVTRAAQTAELRLFRYLVTLEVYKKRVLKRGGSWS
jgi:hypothetical protein